MSDNINMKKWTAKVQRLIWLFFALMWIHPLRFLEGSYFDMTGALETPWTLMVQFLSTVRTSRITVKIWGFKSINKPRLLLFCSILFLDKLQCIQWSLTRCYVIMIWNSLVWKYDQIPYSGLLDACSGILNYCWICYMIFTLDIDWTRQYFFSMLHIAPICENCMHHLNNTLKLNLSVPSKSCIICPH